MLKLKRLPEAVDKLFKANLFPYLPVGLHVKLRQPPGMEVVLPRIITVYGYPVNII